MTTRAGTPTHLDLLAGLRAVQAVAASADHARVRVAVRRLRDDLRAHVADEQQGQGGLSAALAQTLMSGQQRLLSLAGSLEEEACNESATPCTVRIAELAALVRRQAGVEQRVAGLIERSGDGSDAARRS